jgi:chromosomal replication initiator protein
MSRIQALEAGMSLMRGSRDEEEEVSGALYRRSPSVRKICVAVADRTATPLNVMLKRTNAVRSVLPRQIAFYLCREFTQLSFPQIGVALGGYHHTTVLHGAAQIRDKRQTDSELDAAIADIERELQGQ